MREHSSRGGVKVRQRNSASPTPTPLARRSARAIDPPRKGEGEVSITLDVLAAVLAAAFLHASWNALVRGGSDPLKTSFAVAGGGALLCVPVALFLPLPAPASWPYLAVSGLVHVGYFVVLGLAYRKADLSVAYPLMRGGAPLFTTLIAISWFGDPVTTGGIAGVVLVSLGIVGLAGDALLKRGMTATTALIIATMIAIVVIYTLADGQGARLSGSVASYIAWGFAFNAIMLAPFAIWGLKGDFHTGARARLARPSRRRLVGGVLRHCAVGHDEGTHRRRGGPARDLGAVRHPDGCHLPQGATRPGARHRGASDRRRHCHDAAGMN